MAAKYTASTSNPPNDEWSPEDHLPSAPTFQPGDRVRVNSPDDLNVVHGLLGTVQEANNSIGWCIVQLDNDPSTNGNWHFRDSQIELVERPQGALRSEPESIARDVSGEAQQELVHQVVDLLAKFASDSIDDDKFPVAEPDPLSLAEQIIQLVQGASPVQPQGAPSTEPQPPLVQNDVQISLDLEPHFVDEGPGADGFHPAFMHSKGIDYWPNITKGSAREARAFARDSITDARNAAQAVVSQWNVVGL